ncbi:MAG: FAD-binding protein [Rhizobiales bacterium]|nr:FAD-binding protein [Hyphomicrobiales bacterium]
MTASNQLSSPPAWRNWAGNQKFVPGETAKPRTEDEAIAILARTLQQGRPVRAAGAGHSFTPIVETSGLLLDLDGLQGVLSVDQARKRVTALAQTRIHAFGDALWQHGLALANQGDIDTQAIAGAIATGTHGSGVGLRSFSASLTGARLVDGLGAVRDIALEAEPDTLHALQTSIGMLGIMTRVTITVSPAYFLHEQIVILHIDDVLARWDDLRTRYRHFSFFWMPSDESADLYGLHNAGKDFCMVKLYNEVPDGFSPAAPGERADRSYRIYPQVFEPNFHEMEYFMPDSSGRQVFAEMRQLMLKSLPDSKYPMEVRFVAADEGWLSPNYRRASIVVSVSGTPGTDYWSYLRACDAVFRQFDGRPHWGKLHFITPERLEGLFPRYDDFKRVRRKFDPQGLFLNPHLAALFK